MYMRFLNKKREDVHVEIGLWYMYMYYFSTNFVNRRYNPTSVNKGALSFLLCSDVNSLFSGRTSFVQVSNVSSHFLPTCNGMVKLVWFKIQ